MVDTIQEYFDTLDTRFNAQAAGDLDALFQFELSGDNAVNYNVHVNQGGITVAKGEHESPTVTLKMKTDNYLKLVNGKLDGRLAFMTGKLKVTGNVAVAMKMEKLFPPG